MEGKTIDSGGKKDRFWWDLGRWSGGKTKATTSTHDKRRHGMGHRTFNGIGHMDIGTWDIGTLGGHHWDIGTLLGHGTLDRGGHWDIGTWDIGHFKVVHSSLPHHTHNTHTPHTTHTCSCSAFHTCPQPQPTPLPYGVCWRLALLSLQCVRTAPPPSGPSGV